MRYFIHQKIRITDNVVKEDPSIEITKILKIKITIKKRTHLIIKGKFQNFNFCGSKSHWEKTVQMP